MDRIQPLFTASATVREAHENICPDSQATRGNVHVELEVSGA